MLVREFEWLGDIIGNRAKLSPDKEAILDLDNNITYTFKDLNHRANRLANFMSEQCDIKKGDRVAFISRNRIEMFDGVFACGKLGAIFVPYNLRLSVGELTLLMDEEEPKVLFFEDLFSPVVEQLKDNITTINKYITLHNADNSFNSLNTSNYNSMSYEDLMKYENTIPVRCRDLNLEDIYLLIHTGGTTGLPKGAMISHRAVLFNAINNITDWGLSPMDKVHLLLPLFHTGGWNILTLGLLLAGGQLLINKDFDPKLSLKIINDYKTNYVFGAATIFRMMYEEPEFNTTNWSSVKWVMSGAAPTPIQVMKKFWAKGVKICAGYGLTEGGPMNLGTPINFIDLDKIKEKHASVGKPFYFTTAKIVDDNGQEVESGSTGELIFTGPQIFSGYWKNEEETKKTLKNGWVYTGDMARMDDEGFIYIVGRKKNIYISGGENVFPAEIERVLYQMNEIHECCVIGVPDEKWGEVGKAVISLKKDMSLEKKDVIAFLSNKLAKYKVPKYVTFVHEVPKNSVGKIVSQDVINKYGKAED